MVMVGRVRLALYWIRLALYQEILEPASVVSRVRLGAYPLLRVILIFTSTFVLI
jgi:hypothetical protein